MEFPIKMLVVIILCLVAALIIVLMITGFGSQTQDSMGGFFDFFNNLLGFGGD